jgi:hypothetical protein
LCDRIVVNLYDADNTLVVGDLLEAQGTSFTDELAGDGSAKFSISPLAPDLVTDPDLLENGIVKFGLELVEGDPAVEVFAAELVPTSGSAGEPGTERFEVVTPGLRNLLARAPVSPERGGIGRYTKDARVFGWMSERFAPWYDASEWTTPVSEGTVYPGWPAPSTLFITAEASAAPGEVHLFRGELWVTVSKEYRVIYYGDDRTWFYVDGELQSQNEPTGHSVSFDVFLEAGVAHVFAAQVQNVYADELKFACNVGTIVKASDGNGTRMGTVLLKTDLTHWKAHKVVGAKPGWTPGAILLHLLNEAQGLGVEGASFLVADFDEDVDSNGDAWPKKVTDRAFNVGAPMTDVVRELEETYCDCRVLPDGTFQAFVNQGQDVSATVALQWGVNLLGLSWQGVPIRGTRLLLRAQEGWTSKIDAAGLAAYGLRFATITSGLSVSIDQGQHLADETVPRMARPNYVYTATFRAVDGAVPWLDFGVGYTITAPDRKGDDVAMRVLSLSASSPSDTPGPVTFTAELEVP